MQAQTAGVCWLSGPVRVLVVCEQERKEILLCHPIQKKKSLYLSVFFSPSLLIPSPPSLLSDSHSFQVQLTPVFSSPLTFTLTLALAPLGIRLALSSVATSLDPKTTSPLAPSPRSTRLNSTTRPDHKHDVPNCTLQTSSYSPHRVAG